jgi:hypothetical protein
MMPDAQHANRLRWFLGLVLFFGVAYYYASNAEIMLGDPDLWWHIVTGQSILNTGHVPTTDLLSYTHAGKPWIAKEWLSQVILALAFNLGSWKWVLYISALAASAGISLTYLEISKHIKPFIVFLLLFFIAFVLTPITVARPHIFTFVLMVFFAIRMFRSVDENRAPEFWLLALVTLWTNLHGSFTLAFAIAGFAFLYMLETTRLQDRGLILRWVLFGLLCPVAALINPYFLDPFLVNRTLIGGIRAMEFLVEWQPFNAQESMLFEFVVLASIGIVWAAAPKLKITKIIFVLFTLHMMLTHIRFLYVFFLLAPIAVAREIALQNPNLTFKKFSEDARDEVQKFISQYISVIGTVFVVAALGFMIWSPPKLPPPDRNIQGAFDYIKTHNLIGPVFNDYNLGGPLIMQGVKTYIDGRADQIFLGQFFDDYISTFKPGHEDVLAKILETNKVTWTIFPAASYQNKWLATQSGWKKTFDSEHAVIFEKVEN